MGFTGKVSGRRMVIYKISEVGDLITMNFHCRNYENPIRELESEMRKYSTIDADSAIVELKTNGEHGLP